MNALVIGSSGWTDKDAIRQALAEQGVAQPPSVRTINRILARRGALDDRRRTRRPCRPHRSSRPRNTRCPRRPYRSGRSRWPLSRQHRPLRRAQRRRIPHVPANE